MVPKFYRRDSSDAVAKIQTALGDVGSECADFAPSAQAAADFFLRTRSEEGRLARGSRLIGRVGCRGPGDSALKRAVIGLTIEALGKHSNRFESAWTVLTCPEGPYGLPGNVTLAYLQRQPDAQRFDIHPSLVQQWERDLRMQLATSGVLAKLVISRAPRLSEKQLAAIQQQRVGLERIVASALGRICAVGAREAHGPTAPEVPLRAAEYDRWHTLLALDCAQQSRGGKASPQAQMFLTSQAQRDDPAFLRGVRALIQAFSGVDVAAVLAFYATDVGRTWLSQQTELIYTDLEQLWDTIDQHTQRIDRWMRTMA